MARWHRADIVNRTHLSFRVWGSALAVAVVLISGSAWATHEVDHRFVVSGSVLAADGSPRADLKVVVAHPRTQLSETVFTDRHGAYSAVLHLHDQDAGDPVTVTAGDEVKTIKADYTPADHHTPRTARVDFGPSVGVAAESSNTAWWYAIGGVVLAGGVWYWRLRGRGTRRSGKAGPKAARRPKGRSNA